MSNIEQDFEQMASQVSDEPEVALPSLEEQQAIVAKLRKLEAEGKLTPEILAEYFQQFSDEQDAPVH